MNIIYYSFFNNFIEIKAKVKDNNRKNYIDSITNAKRRNQSIAVWKLLEYATFKLFNKDFSYENENGVWQEINHTFNFSLSHSNNLVAVIISDNELVGVDCELLSDKILKFDKVFGLTDVKFSSKDRKKRYLTKLWCKKESDFKARSNIKGHYRFIKNNGEEYCIYASSNSDVKFKKISFDKVLKETL